ncbi:LYR motif-containing protein, partial [Ooceraea biroi]
FQVLRIFKILHRTRLRTFEGDDHALQVIRSKINEEYRKYKNVTNSAAIEELNRYALEVDHEIRTTVIQAVETAPGRLALRITPDVLIDNVPYKDQEDNSGKENKSQPECEKSTTPKIHVEVFWSKPAAMDRNRIFFSINWRIERHKPCTDVLHVLRVAANLIDEIGRPQLVGTDAVHRSEHLDELLADSAISSSVAGSDQIRHATALEKCGELRTAVESIDELDHLHQP